jgi:uncharacterized protein with GYD domain
VRFRHDDLKAVEVAVTKSNLTVSEWARNASQTIRQSAERVRETRKLIEQSDDTLRRKMQK